MEEKELTTTSKKATTKSTTKKANTKKTDENNGESVEELKAALQEAQELNKKMAEMLASFQSGQMSMQQPTNTNYANERITIQFNMHVGMAIKNSSKEKVIAFERDGETATISLRQYEGLKTPENIKLFKRGYLSFVGDSEKYYDIEGIAKPKFIPTLENVKELFNGDYNTVTAKLKEVIAGSEIMSGEIYWKSIRLIANDELGYAARNIIANYWNRDVDNAVSYYVHAVNTNFIKE